MKSKLSTFACLFATAAILLYAGARFVIGGGDPGKIVVHSDAPASGALRQFISNNAGDLSALPEKALAEFPAIDRIAVKNNHVRADVWIKHKRIIGVWQDGSDFYPLAANGAPVGGPLAARPSGVLAFRGAVPSGASEIAKIVSARPEIAKRTGFLEYVEGRRWNINLTGGGVIMLPERDEAAALAQISESGVIGRSFRILDLRNAGRMLVK
jgi:hypothetical protein